MRHQQPCHGNNTEADAYNPNNHAVTSSPTLNLLQGLLTAWQPSNHFDNLYIPYVFSLEP